MFQQRIPKHSSKQERRIDAHVVLQTVVGVLQHLRQNTLHWRVLTRREVTCNLREQRLEQLVFTEFQIGRVTVTCLQQLE
ncbi:hypothetical protein D3C78_1369290 [compost metagenome]